MSEKEPIITVLHSKHGSYKGLATGVISQGVQWMRQGDARFGRNADLKEALGGAGILGRHFEQVSDEARRIISGVQLKLNDYLKTLGIGLKSVEAHPLTKNWLGMIKDTQMFSGSEHKYPTIGLRTHLNPRDSRIVLFGPEAGEGLISLSDRLSAKRFTSDDLNTDSAQSVGHISKGEYMAAKKGQFIGVPLNIIDPLKFANSGLQSAELDREQGIDAKDEAQQMYLCIYLIREAIQDLLRNGKNTKNKFLVRKFGLAA